MDRRRVQDGLAGAVIAVGVMLLVLMAVLWSLTDPVTDEGPAQRPSAAGSGSRAGSGPPADLAPGETWLGDFTLDAGALATPDSRLQDLHAVGRGARTGADGVTVGTLEVDVTVPFAVVAEQIGDRTTIRPADEGPGATVVRSLVIAGRELRVAATGTIDVEDGRLVIEPQTIDIGGPELLSRGLGAVARRLVTIDETVEGLPDGLVLQDVRVRDDGLRATLRGQDVVLTQEAPGSP